MKVEVSTHPSLKFDEDETTIRIELTGTVEELPTIEEVHALLVAVQATVRTRQEVYAAMLGDLERWQPTGFVNPAAIEQPPGRPVVDGSWFLPSDADAARAVEEFHQRWNERSPHPVKPGWSPARPVDMPSVATPGCGDRMPTVDGVIAAGFSVPPPTFSASPMRSTRSFVNEVLPPGLVSRLREQAAIERNEQAMTWWRATRRRYGIEPDMPC